MRTEHVTLHSRGERLSALWRTPDVSGAPIPAVVQGPGWLGLKDGSNYVKYHEAICARGIGVLVVDYRGSGESEGDRSVLSMRGQLDDLRAAISWLGARDGVDAGRLGCFGSGGTGASHAIELAASDPRVRATVAQLPIADGADWLRRMRSESEWRSFLAALEHDRRERATGGLGRRVDPREQIAVPTAERRTTTVKADVDGRAPSRVGLEAADELLDYRPVVSARRCTVPTLIVAVEDDDVTPQDHAEALYRALAGPKELLLLRHTTHYASYERYGAAMAERIGAWFDEYLRDEPITTRRSRSRTEGTTAAAATAAARTEEDVIP